MKNKVSLQLFIAGSIIVTIGVVMYYLGIVGAWGMIGIGFLAEAAGLILLFKDSQK